MIEIHNEWDPHDDGQWFSTERKNFGHKLFAYIVPRIMSELLNYNLIVPDNSYIGKVNQNTKEFERMLFPFESILDRNSFTENVVELNDNSLQNSKIENFVNGINNNKIYSRCHCSNYEYIKPYKGLVKQIMKDLILPKSHHDDILVMLRRSRRASKYQLPDSFYLKIIDSEKFDKMYISVDDIDRHYNLYQKIKKYNPIILEGNILENFKKATSFNKIIGCQGQFSFWAAWLSEAEKIYWPVTNTGPNAGLSHNGWGGPNLTVDDEERYVNIKIENIYSE
jgi:hypothetical protein